MSIPESFFTNRHKQLQKLKESGYIDIDELESDYGIASKRLIDAGYLVAKELITAADLYEFHVSSRGKALYG